MIDDFKPIPDSIETAEGCAKKLLALESRYSAPGRRLKLYQKHYTLGSHVRSPWKKILHAECLDLGLTVMEISTMFGVFEINSTGNLVKSLRGIARPQDELRRQAWAELEPDAAPGDLEGLKNEVNQLAIRVVQSYLASPRGRALRTHAERTFAEKHRFMRGMEIKPDDKK